MKVKRSQAKGQRSPHAEETEHINMVTVAPSGIWEQAQESWSGTRDGRDQAKEAGPGTGP